MTEEHKNIEIRSEEVQDILGQVPSWIIRWGTLIVLFTIGLLLAGSWILKYPDIRRAEILITTENPPATLVAKTSGTIDQLFVADSQLVSPAQHLALIENAASYRDIIELQGVTDSLSDILPDFSSPTTWDLRRSFSLGEVQPSYAQFVKLYQDYLNFRALDYHNQKINAIRLEIKKHEAYYRRLREQSNILRRELKLVETQFARDSSLYAGEFIAEVEYEKSEAALLQKRFEYEQAGINMSTTEIEISRLNQQILELELTAIEQAENQEIALMESFENLTAQLALWEQKYLLTSPIEGVVTFTRIWSENQNVRVGDKVMTVIPEDQGEIIGKISLPVEGSGKVRTSQRVNIKLNNYPHMDYGMVKGIVTRISLVPADNNYTVEVELPKGLITYYDIEIPFNQEMSGQAEILTDELRLIQRIINPIRSVISTQRESGP